MSSQKTRAADNDAPAMSSPRCRLLIQVLVLPCLAGVCGCGSVPIYDQQLVSKPSMQFSQSSVFQYQCPVFSQLETGLAFSGGAQPTTCSACK